MAARGMLFYEQSAHAIQQRNGLLLLRSAPSPPWTNGWERAGQEHRRGQVEGLEGQGQDTALAVPHTWPERTEHVHWSAFQPLACVLPAQIDADSFVIAGCRCTTNRTLTCGAWMACRV